MFAYIIANLKLHRQAGCE